jgi:erythronate-4-phosphate dehydrogenase
MSLSAIGRSEEDVLAEAVRRIYDIEADDARMRASCVPDPAARATAFDRLRKTYPERREFPHTQLTLRDAAPTLVAKAAGLGFTLHP